MPSQSLLPEKSVSSLLLAVVTDELEEKRRLRADVERHINYSEGEVQGREPEDPQSQSADIGEPGCAVHKLEGDYRCKTQ